MHVTSQEQLVLDLLVEPTKLYQPDKLRVPGRFALCTKISGGERIDQELFDVSQLDFVMRQVAKMSERDRHHIWISQSTLVPYAQNRRISSVMLLNACWVDIDLAHPPKGFHPDQLPPWHYDRDAEILAQTLAMQVEDATGIVVSQVVATGGGLLLRLNFEEALPAVARPRWSSVQKHLIKVVSDLRPAAGFTGARQWRWPVDASACDPSRVLRLVGTVNPRWRTQCRVVYETGVRHNFNQLADQLLPYTQQEVADFRARIAEGKVWTKNRQDAAKAGILAGSMRPDHSNKTQDMISDEAARMLWSSRFEFARAVFTDRGGVEEGHRNNYFWPVANALAWSCNGTEQLTQELAALHHQHFSGDGWTRGEAMQAAGTVLKRMRDGKDRLYKMRTPVFTGMLGVTPDEMKAHGHLLSCTGSTHNLNRSAWEVGAMGFEKMQGLSIEEFIAETRRRQGEAGRRSAEVRSTTLPYEMRQKAQELASQGLSTRHISLELGVSQPTVVRWLKSH